jgi:gluconolactonase
MRSLLLALLAIPTLFAADAQPTLLDKAGAGEGPAWSPQGGLYYSGGNKIQRRNADGSTDVFRSPSGGSNGLLFDPQGRLIVCESASRRITRTEADGSITVLTDNYEGHRYNSPNDLTIDSQGRIYFSDPRYGARESMEMRDSAGRLVEGVYRIDAPGKVTRVLTHELERPNGVLVTPDDRFLYVADNNNNTAGGARKLYRFRLRPDGSVDTASRRLLYDWQTGRGPDGIKIDRKGRLFVAGGLNHPHPPFETADRFKGGIYVFSPQGKLLRFHPVPVDEVTNCAFGGADRKTLFITAGGTLWSMPVDTPGRLPFEKN